MTKELSYIKTIVVFGENKWSDAGVIDFSTFNNAVEPSNNFECTPQNVMENISLILCSSGTTGLPKGVMITQHNIMVGIYAH